MNALIKTEQAKRITQSLSGCALSIYLHILYTEHRSQEIVINMNVFKQENKIKSNKTFYTGIKELISVGILSRISYNKYLLNKEFIVCNTD